MPIAVIIDQDDNTPDDANYVEKNTNKYDGDDDKEDEDDNTTHNAKLGSNPSCDWEGEKCYSLGIRPLMCRCSGCQKCASVLSGPVGEVTFSKTIQ